MCAFNTSIARSGCPSSTYTRASSVTCSSSDTASALAPSRATGARRGAFRGGGDGTSIAAPESTTPAAGLRSADVAEDSDVGRSLLDEVPAAGHSETRHSSRLEGKFQRKYCRQSSIG